MVTPVQKNPRIPGGEDLKSILGIELCHGSVEDSKSYVISVHGESEFADDKSEDASAGAAVDPVYGQQKKEEKEAKEFRVSGPLSKALGDRVSGLKAFAVAKKFKGGLCETKSYFSSPKDTVVLAGVGEVPITADYFQRAGDKVGSVVYEDDPEEITIHFGASSNLTLDGLSIFLQRIMYNSYRSQHYHSKPAPARSLKKINVIIDDQEGEGKEGKEGKEVKEVLSGEESSKRFFEEARVLAYAAAVVAVLVDAPPNYCTPGNFVSFVQDQISQHGLYQLEVRVMDEHACASEGMGAFCAVAQGSRYGARVLHLKYRGEESEKSTPIAMVGKGITMDTGGYSVKVNNSMLWMKCDMGGAAAVTGTLLALALLKPKKLEVHSFAMLCENMIDKDAYRPGDIITAMDGQTIEIQNTDAEGRLALADGILYAQKVTENKAILLDCATLTGAAIVGLGDDLTAVYANTDAFRNTIVDACNAAGEPAWPMPLHRRYQERLKASGSPSGADIRNACVGAADGGSITAALFLKKFIKPNVKWAHLDVAPSAWDFRGNMSTGWGPASLYKLLNHDLSQI